MGSDPWSMTMCTNTSLIEKQDLVKHNEMPGECYPFPPITICAKHCFQFGVYWGAKVNVTSPQMDSKFLEQRNVDESQTSLGLGGK